MRIVALDNYDNRVEGQEYDAPEHQAQQLIKKGLARAVAEGHQNKMMPATRNEDLPSSAAGEAQQSSASRAAPVLGKTTAEQYPGGGLVTPDPRFAAPAKKKPGRKPAAKKAAKKDA